MCGRFHLDRLGQFRALLQDQEGPTRPLAVQPKVMALLDLLARQRAELGDGFCGIIFVEQQMTAHCLAQTLNLWQGDLLALPVVGVGTMPDHIRYAPPPTSRAARGPAVCWCV